MGSIQSDLVVLSLLDIGLAFSAFAQHLDGDIVSSILDWLGSLLTQTHLLGIEDALYRFFGAFLLGRGLLGAIVSDGRVGQCLLHYLIIGTPPVV